MLSGRTVLGPEAVALGLADECVTDDTVLDAAQSSAPLHTRRTRRHSCGGSSSSWPETRTRSTPVRCSRREIAALQQAYETPEHKEAVATCLEKRKPNFR